MVIVAAVDRSERASSVVREASELGEAFDVPVKVVHVLTQKKFVSLERTSVSDTGQTIPTNEVIDLAKELAAEAIEEAGVEAEPVGLLGDPADEVVDYAHSNDAKYIVVSGRKQSPVGKALFGSVVQSVLLSAECPVVSLRTD